MAKSSDRLAASGQVESIDDAARPKNCGAGAEDGADRCKGLATRGVQGWRACGLAERTSSEPPGPAAEPLRQLRAVLASRNERIKSLLGWEEFAPPKHPPTPIWKGRHALRAGPCLVRQHTCG